MIPMKRRPPSTLIKDISVLAAAALLACSDAIAASAVTEAPASLTLYRCYICHADREVGVGPAFADVGAYMQGVGAAVPYYGGGMTVGAEAARKPKCPVLCHFGDQDKHITLDTVKAFKAAHSGGDEQTEVQVYAADHGFNCDQRGSFNAAAAELALERTLDFFGNYVR